MTNMGAVHLKITGGRAELRLDNPAKLNCLTMDMLEQMETHLEAVERASSAVCVLLTAEDSKAFCSGADITGWGNLSPVDFARHWVRRGHRVFDRLAALSAPVIAVMNGHALGGGLELAAACDIRMMRPGVEIGLPESGVGVVPGWSGTQRLRRLLPEPVIKEMALFGRRIDAARANALGFAAEVSEDAAAAAEAAAARIEGLSPRAVETAKAMIHAGAGEQSAPAIEALGGAAVAASADRKEGVAAFREKRKPVFPGG